jgi:hypothetical protein
MPRIPYLKSHKQLLKPVVKYGVINENEETGTGEE